MALDPRTRDEVYESLKSNLRGRIESLTNFAENTFNYVWTQAYSQELHKQEVAASAVQLTGWADYVGKELTEDDLEDLGIDGATPAEINQFMRDQHLDEFAKAFGVSRDPGSAATGEVDVTTNESTHIPADTEFGTEPDSDGNYLSFYTTDDVTTDDATTVTIGVEAATVGNEYNVGANTITYMPNPPAGVSDVTNTQSTSGGKNEQTNDQLRQDVKNAVIQSTEGGTTDGVAGYIEDNTGASDVIVDEKFSGDDDRDYPHAHVIVLGGTVDEVEAAIEYAHPSAVEHILDRPQAYNVNLTAELNGSSINDAEVESEISSYFDGLLLGDDVIRDKLIQIIMNADEDILNIMGLVLEVDGEVHTYDGSSVYSLDKGGYMQDDGIEHVEDGSGQVYVEDIDYVEVDDDGDGEHDALDWTVADPDSDTTTLTYEDGTATYTVDDRMVADGIVEVTDADGNTYTEGTDFEEADTNEDGNDNGIDWSVGGSSPADGVDFDVTYDRTSDTPDDAEEFYVSYCVQEDLPVEKTEVGQLNETDITVV